MDHEANVISMSWTMYKAGDNNDGINKLVDTIKNAGKKIKGKDSDTRNTLMFCASEDSSHSSYRQPYPATDYNDKIIKRVGSAGIYGERANYVDPEAIDYLFPGEIVSSRKLCSGSSTSTALAAGLSALILWCAALQKAEANPSSSTTEAKMHPVGPLGTGHERINFQTHTCMYGLFDDLRSSKQNPLVNITKILHEAAAQDNPPAALIEHCKYIAQARNLFRDSKG